MTKIVSHDCYISGVTLGYGLTPEEAKLNAQESPETRVLTIRGGDLVYERLVYAGIIPEETSIVVRPAHQPVVRSAAVRTINLGVMTDPNKPAKEKAFLALTAACINMLLYNIMAVSARGFDYLGTVQTVSALLDGFALVHDVSEAPADMLRGLADLEEELGLSKPAAPETTSDLREIATFLAGPDHEVGPVVVNEQEQEQEVPVFNDGRVP